MATDRNIEMKFDFLFSKVNAYRQDDQHSIPESNKNFYQHIQNSSVFQPACLLFSEYQGLFSSG
jgi:hypothetical protein